MYLIFIFNSMAFQTEPSCFKMINFFISFTAARVFHHASSVIFLDGSYYRTKSQFHESLSWNLIYFSERTTQKEKDRENM